MGPIHQLSESAADSGYQCKMEMDFWLVRTYALYAEFHKRNGDQSKAKENLTKAIEILKECGADGWVEKYEKELTAIS